MNAFMLGVVLVLSVDAAQAQAPALPRLSVAEVTQAINAHCFGVQVEGACSCSGNAPDCVVISYYVPTQMGEPRQTSGARPAWRRCEGADDGRRIASGRALSLWRLRRRPQHDRRRAHAPLLGRAGLHVARLSGAGVEPSCLRHLLSVRGGETTWGRCTTIRASISPGGATCAAFPASCSTSCR